MDIFLQHTSETFSNYRIVMAMDRAAWHTGLKNEKPENIVPLFQPPYSPEVNPVENMWEHIREAGGFKNATFKSLNEVELRLADELKKLDEKTVKSITLFRWIKEAIC
jgi:transposase